jgi:hypothetical protein
MLCWGFSLVALTFRLRRRRLLANATGVPLLDFACDYAFGFLAVFVCAIPALFGLPPRMQLFFFLD